MEPSNKRIHAVADKSMEPPSKRICAADDDRLSDLPDCLIHSILSYLESRQVVRSSVLSRRWMHLWRSVPCIDIDFTLFRRQNSCRSRKCCQTDYGQKKVCKKEWRPFEAFSDKLLLIHSAPSLDKLRIHVPALDLHDRQAIRPCLGWIGRGLRCSPRTVDIHMDFYWGVEHWYHDNIHGPFPDMGSSSSRLTRLQLHGVKLDENFAEHLRSGYPVLEDLSLVRCFCRFGDIVSGRLRHLTIDDCLVDRQFQGIVVAAPRMTSFRTFLNDIYCPNGIHVMDTACFIKASVRLTTLYKTNASSFLGNLYRIFNIRHLELVGSETTEVLQQISDKLPHFHNVRTLLMDRCDLKTKADIQMFDRFLQSVPSLEKLTLQNCEFTDRSKRRTARAQWRTVALESQNLMSFKCDNLEMIEFKHSKDDNVDELFELLMGLWRNLGKTNIKLTRV